ncbi:hypothetical protein TrLO_g10066 [Triparma laevis f. longispina]|uniref:Kinesin light chain n=1 Tax=Triparma laevis f. longispina TaxID=1714387 RepID=A0A9W7F3F5_9STRA|nr:hypothetical protein TrLO_g10066 [Triparma laevis f. longispina]
MTLEVAGLKEKARATYVTCLEGQVKVLKKDDEGILHSLNNLGTVNCDLGNYEKGLEFLREELEGKERALGKTHPRILMTLDNIGNLALVLKRMGKIKRWNEVTEKYPLDAIPFYAGGI